MIFDHEHTVMGHSKILEFHKFFSEYQIWLAVDLERFKIKIRIFEANDGRFHFVQSHYMRVLRIEGEASPTLLSHETAHLALSTAIESITTYYDDAVAEGHEPSVDWFVINQLF